MPLTGAFKTLASLRLSLSNAVHHSNSTSSRARHTASDRNPSLSAAMDAVHAARDSWSLVTAPLSSGAHNNIHRHLGSSDGGTVEHASPLKHSLEVGTISRFACPFYACSPRQHMDCITLKLARIRDVKQHLQSQHGVSTWFCQRCFRPFSTKGLRDDHSQHLTCASRVRGPRYPDAISFEQPKEQVFRKLKPRDQWYAVWVILFPQTPPPSNPYLGSPMAEVSNIILKYWGQKGQRIADTLFPSAQLPEFHKNHSKILKELLDQVQEEFGPPKHEGSNTRCRSSATQPGSHTQHNITQEGHHPAPSTTSISPLESAKTNATVHLAETHLLFSPGPGWDIGGSQLSPPTTGPQQLPPQTNTFDVFGGYNSAYGMSSTSMFMPMPMTIPMATSMPVIPNSGLYPLHSSTYRPDDFDDHLFSS